MISQNWTHSFEVSGRQFTARLMPCSFMYPGYGVQILIEMGDGGGSVHFKSSVPFAEATEQTALDLLTQLKTCACKKCGALAFDHPEPITNRAGLCEKCFVANLYADYEKALTKEKAKVAKREVALKAKGYAYRVDAWVHGNSGDDRQISWYTQIKPTEAAVRKMLKKAGCVLETDYTVTKL